MVTERFEGKRGRKQASKPHDPEKTAQLGMSSEAVAEDEAETMASTGNSSNSFQEIVSGTATGLGVDRGEFIGTGGLAAGEDLDDVAAGDYWRQNFERNPYREPDHPYDRYEPGERLGWVSAAGLDPREEGMDEIDKPILPEQEEEAEEEE
jgi:hypothetical protein